MHTWGRQSGLHKNLFVNRQCWEPSCSLHPNDWLFTWNLLDTQFIRWGRTRCVSASQWIASLKPWRAICVVSLMHFFGLFNCGCKTFHWSPTQNPGGLTAVEVAGRRQIIWSMAYQSIVSLHLWSAICVESLIHFFDVIYYFWLQASPGAHSQDKAEVSTTADWRANSVLLFLHSVIHLTVLFDLYYSSPFEFSSGRQIVLRL